MNDPRNEKEDPLLGLLTAARPAPEVHGTAETSDSPTAQALLGRIVATSTREVTLRRGARNRRVRTAVGAASVAAAIVVAVVAVNSVGFGDGRVLVRQEPASADVAAIARASVTALASSGRAELTFDDGRGGPGEQRGTSEVAFSGQDLDVSIHFDAVEGRPAFDARNMTVGNEFYLYDGPIGAKHWVHDTTATPTGSGIFDADPRQLLGILQPSAAFVVVGTSSTPRGVVRHLRATIVTDLPTLHLSLGPLDGHDITSLDVWVGADDTVQSLALTTRHTESGALPCVAQNGVKQCAKVGDKLQRTRDGRIRIISGDATADPADGPAIVVAPKPLTTIGSYSVSFTDVGAPIAITAPAHATTVAGVG